MESATFEASVRVVVIAIQTSGLSKINTLLYIIMKRTLMNQVLEMILSIGNDAKCNETTPAI